MSASVEKPHGFPTGGQSPTPGLDHTRIDMIQIENMIMINNCSQMWMGEKLNRSDIHSIFPLHTLDNKDNIHILKGSINSINSSIIIPCRHAHAYVYRSALTQWAFILFGLLTRALTFILVLAFTLTFTLTLSRSWRSR